MPEQLGVLHRHADRVPVADATADVGSLPKSGGDEIYDGDRRAGAEAVEVLVGNEPGMAADGVASAVLLMCSLYAAPEITWSSPSKVQLWSRW
jgi:hypothetical protein